MKVYVLIHRDRHCDDEILVFQDKNNAVSEAIRRSHKSARHYRDDVDSEVRPWHEKAGIMYWGTYSCEGDHVRVEEKELL